MPLENTANWFKTAKPEHTDKDFYVQMGVHFEEVAEMVDELSPLTNDGKRLLDNARGAVRELANHLKENGQLSHVILHNQDRLQFLDALCDQIVTATGTALFANMDIVGGMNEVNRSNFSKFEDGKPVLQSTGKIGKGSSFTPPDLTPYI